MKLKNYTMSLFASTIFTAGYLIFQKPYDVAFIDDVAVQTVTHENIDLKIEFDYEPDLSAFKDDQDVPANEYDDMFDEDDEQEPVHSYFELPTKNFVTEQERRDLFNQLGLEYLERVMYDYDLGPDFDARLTEAYLEDAENCDDLSNYYQDDIESGLLVPMSIRWLGQDVGYGIFAEEDILQDDLIGVYTGSLQDRNLVDSKDYAWAYPAMTKEGGALSLDARQRGNELRFINDNINPNCTMTFIIGKDNLWHGCYTALRDIKNGEQLFISYGPAYWETRDYKYHELSDIK